MCNNYRTLMLDAAIRNGASLVHQDINNIMIVVMPLPNSVTEHATTLKHTRLLEDKLIQRDLDNYTEISVHFTIPEMNGNDKRKLSHRIRVCTSISTGCSGWSKSEALRGKMGPFPLVRALPHALNYSCCLHPSIQPNW